MFALAASVAEEKLAIDGKVENILTDAFFVLVDNEKKISEAISKNKKGNNEEVDDVEEMDRDQQKKSGQTVNVTEVQFSLDDRRRGYNAPLTNQFSYRLYV